MGEVAGLGKGLSSTPLQVFSWLRQAPSMGDFHQTSVFYRVSAPNSFAIALYMLSDGLLFHSLPKCWYPTARMQRANFCSILGWLYWKIILQFRKEFCWVVLISTDTSRSSVKLTELPVAVGKLREECTTSDHSSTINSQLGWHPL